MLPPACAANKFLDVPSALPAGTQRQEFQRGREIPNTQRQTQPQPALPGNNVQLKKHGEPNARIQRKTNATKKPLSDIKQGCKRPKKRNLFPYSLNLSRTVVFLSHGTDIFPSETEPEMYFFLPPHIPVGSSLESKSSFSAHG